MDNNLNTMDVNTLLKLYEINNALLQGVISQLDYYRGYDDAKYMEQSSIANKLNNERSIIMKKLEEAYHELYSELANSKNNDVINEEKPKRGRKSKSKI